MFLRPSRWVPPTGILLFCLTAFLARADQPATVDHVIDGDTVVLAGGERVRLIGIDTPEGKRIRKTSEGRQVTPAQPFYLEAKRALTALVKKRRVTLVDSEESVDRYGRTLAYMSLADGTDVQQELLRRGLAMVVAYPPNLKHLAVYAKTEAEARRARRGIWGHPYFAVRQLAEAGGAPVKGGLARIAGVITAVSQKGNNLRITVGDSVTILIYLGTWRKFWPGQNADELIGRRITARGKIKPKRRTMRITHPFMLKTEA